MAQPIPETMRGIALAKYSQPKDYTILDDLPVPKIEKPDDVLIKVCAASVNPIDVKFANGMVKMLLSAE